jgi:hypothetical protein
VCGRDEAPTVTTTPAEEAGRARWREVIKLTFESTSVRKGESEPREVRKRGEKRKASDGED